MLGIRTIRIPTKSFGEISPQYAPYTDPNGVLRQFEPHLQITRTGFHDHSGVKALAFETVNRLRREIIYEHQTVFPGRFDVNVVPLRVHAFEPGNVLYHVGGRPEPVHHLSLSAIPNPNGEAVYPECVELALDSLGSTVALDLEGRVELTGLGESHPHNPMVSSAPSTPAITVSM